jgi:hypothetical protein
MVACPAFRIRYGRWEDFRPFGDFRSAAGLIARFKAVAPGKSSGAVADALLPGHPISG